MSKPKDKQKLVFPINRYEFQAENRLFEQGIKRFIEGNTADTDSGMFRIMQDHVCFPNHPEETNPPQRVP